MRCTLKGGLLCLISDKELKGVNSSFRAFSLNVKLRNYRRKFTQLGIDLSDSIVVDAGCGRGWSTALIIKLFQPRKIYAFDYLPKQIELAKKMKLSAKFSVDSITNIQLPSDICDAVFSFNVLHHVPAWTEGINEISRILKPDGYVLFEEPTERYTNFTDKLVRNKHPEEGKFSRKEFDVELRKCGLSLIQDMSTFFGLYLVLLCKNGISS